jgi:hypothetical protein
MEFAFFGRDHAVWGQAFHAQVDMIRDWGATAIGNEASAIDRTGADGPRRRSIPVRR